MTSNNKLQWLRVARTENIGPVTFLKLTKKYTDPSEAISYLLQQNSKIPTLESVFEEVDRLQALGGSLISCMDTHYPAFLSECPDKPAFLYCIGNLSLLKKNMIAIVGSRNSSIYGNRIATDLAERLVENDYVIVSGMASGIDTCAHKGAQSSTIAVLAGGIDVIYPASNTDLYNFIRTHGLVISEAPLGSPISPLLFHARNRIIAGLAMGTVIVEGMRNSGSMITVGCAQGYHRDIFAVPGCPLEPRSYGPNKVIKNGAYVVTDVDDILQNLQPTYRPKINLQYAPRVSQQIDELHDKILVSLTTVGISIEDLHSQLGVPISQLRSALIDLELDGKILIGIGESITLNV